MAPTSSLRILLIEDNPGDAHMLMDLFDDVPEPRFAVEHVESVDAARSALERGQPDVILLDLNLPESRGLETIDRVRGFSSTTPIVVLSGGVDEALRESAIQRGAQDVLDKDEPTARLLARAVLYALAGHHLVRRNRQIADILESTPDAVLVVSGTGLVRFANAAAERLFGQPQHELVGRTLGFPVDDAHPRALDRLGADASRVGEMRVGECDWEGQPSRVVSIRDVTDEHRLRTKLDTAEARLGHALASSDAVLLTSSRNPADPGTQLGFVSEGVTRVLGYTVAEALAPGWWIGAVHPDDAPRVAAAVPDVLASGVANPEYRMRHADGTYRWVSAHTNVVTGPEGAEPEAVTILVDVTARRNLERQIQLSHRMEAVGMLAGGVAHDFNNVLTAIYSCAESAQRALAPGHTAADEVLEIQRAAERAASLTRQLLAFGRQQVLEPRVVDMNDAISEMGKLLRRLIGEHVKLTLGLTPEPAPVFVDLGQLEQIIVNLAVNARDAMPDGGTLAIESAARAVGHGIPVHEDSPLPPGEYVVLSVTDTGIGMDDATRERIFEPYFSTKETGSGTGLGLATVYGIVKQSDGSIRVDSTPGEGTAVHVFFPRSDVPLPEDCRAPRPPLEGGQETILFVEDDDGVRRAGADILRALGYRLVVAGNGNEALTLLDETGTSPDLVVTDVVMPLMGGQRLADEVRRRSPETAVLFVSGYSRDAVLHHGKLASESSFLPKPYTPFSLSRRVRELLDAAPGS